MSIFLWNTIHKKKAILTEESITILDERIIYTKKISARARTLRLTINRNGEITITAPRHLTHTFIEHFIIEKYSWIYAKREQMKALPPVLPCHNTKQEYALHKHKALILATEKTIFFNQFYNLTYKTIRIKNQKTLWGSCSRHGNLNFNYKIALLPEDLANYIIVHELCHLKEFNHSSKFWDLVATTIPNHQELRKKLKTTGLRSM